jgi:hypothetical protein
LGRPKGRGYSSGRFKKEDKKMKLAILICLVILCDKAYSGCSPPVVGKRQESRSALEKRIKAKMEEGDEIVWGKVDSIKYLDSPKELFYDGYNLGDEKTIIPLSEIINKRNPYLNTFNRYYVWFSTVKTNGFVYRVQIGESDSECGHHYIVNAGDDIPFIKSGKTGALKLIEYFYEYGGYKLIPGKEILGKIALEIIWPDAPNLDSLK